MRSWCRGRLLRMLHCRFGQAEEIFVTLDLASWWESLFYNRTILFIRNSFLLIEHA